MKIYVIIGGLHGEESSITIDIDCVFANRIEADEKREEFEKKYPDQFFIVEEVIIPKSIAMECQNSELPEAVQNHADAMSDIGRAIDKMANAMIEFVKCSCTYRANGSSATNPTIVVKKED